MSSPSLDDNDLAASLFLMDVVLVCACLNASGKSIILVNPDSSDCDGMSFRLEDVKFLADTLSPGCAEDRSFAPAFALLKY